MKAPLILFMIVLLAGLGCATSTDGNYTLIQFDFLGSGESTLTDGNYATFADVGEPVVHQAMTDENYSAGAGFYGENIVQIIVVIVEAAAVTISQTIIVMLPILGGNSLISMVMLIVVLGFSAILVLFRNNLKTAIEGLRNEGEKEKGG